MIPWSPKSTRQRHVRVTPDEDRKLKDAVRAHGGKNWKAIAALIPGRSKGQRSNRWHYVSVSNVDPTTARVGKWTADEDRKLKDAVLKHGGKNWNAIAALVQGRTKGQCSGRWHDTLVSQSDPKTTLAGTWTADEDKKLKDAVGAQGAKNWIAIAALVPGRTQKQCRDRWRNNLVFKIDPTTARAGRWTAVEDKKLKDAIPTHGDKNWIAIAALVPGLTNIQCRNRWCNNLVSKSDPKTARVGQWTTDESNKLFDAVPTHGAKNWAIIAAMVSGRTEKQCIDKWTKSPPWG